DLQPAPAGCRSIMRPPRRLHPGCCGALGFGHVGELGRGSGSSHRGTCMDQTTILVLLIVVAAIGVVAVAAILDRDRSTAARTDKATQFASSTEGMRRCPSCGV